MLSSSSSNNLQRELEILNKKIMEIMIDFEESEEEDCIAERRQGKCGVAVIRVSGVDAKQAILKMSKRRTLPIPRRAVLTSIVDPITQEQIDRGIVIWFPGPKSFTGEDSCEFQIHGGPAVITSMMKGLSKLPEYRLAEPGEFTRRAFLVGKMDLTEVEGLADLIHAETEQQRRQALQQMEGSLAELYASWRAALLKNIAYIEAFIDFSENDQIEDNTLEEAQKSLIFLKQEIEKHLSDGRRGERLHSGIRAAIVGEPNVGKSSLLNYLVKRPAAIVTPIAGTTRDIVEVPIDVGGYPLILADTAGLHDGTKDIVELEGIKRAKSWSQSADLVFLVIDAQKALSATTYDEYFEQYKNNIGLAETTIILPVFNKIDLLSCTELNELRSRTTAKTAMVSCKSHNGLPDLISVLIDHMRDLCGNPTKESPSLSQERHRHHLQNTLKTIEESLNLFNDRDVTLGAHKLSLAMKHLGRITGRVTAEDVLDVIFKEFCIGK